MAGISSSGLGSGLDINGLVSQLVAAEGSPVQTRLARQEATLQAKISALGSFKGALSSVQSAFVKLQSFSTFEQRTVAVGDTGILSASAAATASAGRYSVEVTQLAQANKVRSDAFEAVTDAVGTGTLTFQFGTFDSDAGTFTVNPDKATQTVTIDAANNSLQGIRDAVNAADVGVSASIVNDGSGYMLVFSSSESGLENGLKISVEDDDGGDGDAAGLSQLAYDPAGSAGDGKNMTETLAARDALAIIDGITVSSTSNRVSGAIEGVTLNLAKAAIGEPTTVTVSLDKAGVKTALNSFVTAYNDFIRTANQATAYDPETETRGPLLGDAIVRGTISQLRGLFSATLDGLDGDYNSLASIGFKTERDGTLSLDNTVLDKALEQGLEVVGRIFAPYAQTTDALVSYIEAGENAKAGSYAVSVTRLATQGALSGAVIAEPFTIDSANDTLSIRVDGYASSTITLASGSYSGDELAAELQSKINGDSTLQDNAVSVTVAYEGGALVIRSASYGSSSSVNLLSVDTNSEATLGLAVGSGTDGVDVAGTIGGIGAVGEGRFLVGQGAADGLKLEVRGGLTGERGTVGFSRGIAERVREAIDNALDHSIAARLDGLNDRIDDIARQREKLQERLLKLEERYLKQFTALDALLAQLSSTSTFLTNQLAALPKPRTSSSS